MRAIRSTLVLLAILSLNLCLAVSAEDSPETSYDESESLPFEIGPVLCADMVEESALGFTVVPGVGSHSVPAPRHKLAGPGCGQEPERHFSESIIFLYHSLRC